MSSDPAMAEEHGDADVQALVEGRERYRSLFTHNPHAVFSLDLEGRYRDANPAGLRLSGFTRDELCRMGFVDVICPEDHALTLGAFAEVLAGNPQTLECRMRHRDGRILELSLIAVPVTVGGEVVGVHGVAEDVTERNRVARELVAARQAADDANAAKSLFLANVSHELRTPLTSLVAAAEMLQDTELDARQARFVATLERAAERLSLLVDDILGFARLEAGTVEVVAEPFDVRAVLDEVVAGCAARAAEKGLEVSVSVDPMLPPQLVGDALRLSQVVGNLFDNAVKFTDDGRVEVGAEVVRRSPHTVEVRLRVCDTGIGIAPEFREALFDPFTQADPSPTRTHGGAGLGLAICKELVDRMGGFIDVASSDTGTTFTVTVPFGVVGP